MRILRLLAFLHLHLTPAPVTRILITAMVLLLLAQSTPADRLHRASAVLHHQIRMDITDGLITVRDRISINQPSDTTIALYRPILLKHGAATVKLSKVPQTLRYRLHYTGAPVQLLGTASWLYSNPAVRHTFDLAATLPPGWSMMTTGQGGPSPQRTAPPSAQHWRSDTPLADVPVIAGRFHITQATRGVHLAQILLLDENKPLAASYLDATLDYLERYSRLLGRYPYSKFAVVENSQQTGLGMASFTLLGNKVLRLPFILHTSLPHEILHNWWGNGVYVPAGAGNWSEGLTTYLADHWLREERGLGARFRRDALIRFQHFAGSGRDIPLAQFKSRHSHALKTVGYDKSAMVFHMLRLHVGDQAFIAGLRRFLTKYQHRYATFTDIAQSFQDHGVPAFIHQWTHRTGAPRIALRNVTIDREGSLRLLIEQTHTGEPFDLTVPVEVIMANGSVQRLLQRINTQHARVTIPSHGPTAVALALDPHYEVFRTLANDEIPRTFNQLFASDTPAFVLSPALSPAAKTAYRQLAKAWAGNAARFITAEQAQTLPLSQKIWFCGPMIPAAPLLAPFVGPAQLADSEDITVATAPVGARAIAWISATQAAFIRALARRLPHFGAMSYVRFDNTSGAMNSRGQWPVTPSSMRITLSNDSSVDWNMLKAPTALVLPDVTPAGLTHLQAH